MGEGGGRLDDKTRSVGVPGSLGLHVTDHLENPSCNKVVASLRFSSIKTKR